MRCLSMQSALFTSDQLAHPSRGPDRAAEGVEMHADDVARLALQAVAGDRGELLARVGIRDQPADAGTERAQSAQRDAHAAALGVARERDRVGRAGDADVDGYIRRAARELRAVFDDPARREREL